VPRKFRAHHNIINKMVMHFVQNPSIMVYLFCRNDKIQLQRSAYQILLWDFCGSWYTICNLIIFTLETLIITVESSQNVHFGNFLCIIYNLKKQATKFSYNTLVFHTLFQMIWFFVNYILHYILWYIINILKNVVR
jgi:hypothetical protein